MHLRKPTDAVPERRSAPPPAGILQLQRGAGNAAVARWLQRAPAAEAAFAPEPVVDPPSRDARLGERFREDLSVRNADEAVAGTYFNWVADSDGDALDVGKPTETSADGKASVEAVVEQPGPAALRAQLAYHEPGTGPMRSAIAPLVPVVTPAPTLAVEILDAEGVDLRHLAKGDRFTVRARLDGAHPDAEQLGPRWSLGGAGPLRVAEAREVSPNVRELDVEAAALGEFQLQVQWSASATEMPPIRSAPQPGAVVLDRELFSRRCSTAHQLVDAKYDLIGAFTKELAVVYGQAWRNHTQALIGANRMRQLGRELLLGAAVGFVTGGVGGAVGKYFASRFAKDSWEAAIAGDAMKDLWKDTSRRFANVGLLPLERPALQAFPTEPLEWQNLEDAAVLRESGWVKIMIAKWSDAADLEPEFATSFDPVEAIETLAVGGNRPEELTRPDPLERARIEKGFWKAWLGQYGFELVNEMDAPYDLFTRWDVSSNLDWGVTGRVKACADELGEDGDDWIEAWAEPLADRLREIADERNRGF